MEKKRILIISLIVLLFVLTILISIFYYNNKNRVSFETGNDEEILTQYIKRGNKVIEPISPKKDGYIFVEWQKDGSKYDFSDSVNENFILTAKWQKEKYIEITFDNPYFEKVSKKILECTSLTEIPTIDVENFEFIGWFLKNEKYVNQTLCDDTTLVAHYEKIKENPKYSVGDIVTIVNSYSDSINGINTYNEAITWTRIILKIYDHGEYPYMIGNETGVTGFFKEESIKKDN